MSLMERFLPHHQFSEQHQIRIRRRPSELLDIIQTYQPPQDRFGEMAMRARQLPATLMHWLAPSRVPPPAPFTRASFTPLGRDGDREIVGGLVGRFWRPDFGLITIESPSEFLACNRPRTAKLVLGFLAEPDGDATLLTTETRVYCPDRYSMIMFTAYWLVIRPVSGLLRRRTLGTIRRMAEQHDDGPDVVQASNRIERR